ncbi:hypothetical protein Nocox_00820 [Nonomuraea coxensis DSM 45129]|uniref:Uncharacterized protein n=1 Tax=Nonomuraea coxensis DSM 45129 TaxID=1122611 RepID=A0ABX8TQN9_9ACTN|nr:hypothetical protein [Nonomuraea coxensis]QYC37800.1 hypothetical protein Nocox_00820 [Nonomuraea coxensis DSM 45129]
MRSMIADEDSRLLLWLRVREFAVPPTMIERATARRAVGDWAGACAAARVDVDLDLRSVARAHGHEVAARVRDDLRHLAPELLRWHLPRVAPDGLLRPGLTVPLARYAPGLRLVARTPPARAAAGQRFGLELWDADRPAARGHPHPRPHRCFRLDLHRHLWDVRRVDELRVRSSDGGSPVPGLPSWCAADRWADEARLLLRADGRGGDAVVVRLGGRRRLMLDLDLGLDLAALESRITGAPASGAGAGAGAGLPMLPDAATWVLPDLALLRAGLITADRLHPLVAAALVPGHGVAGPGAGAGRADVPGDVAGGGAHLVECRGARHRVGLVDGVLVALDHSADEVRREELLAALGGTPLPCLAAIEVAHRDPGSLDDVRGRLEHGDVAGALAVVERLLGPGASLPDGPLRDELEGAARRRVAHGLFRAGLDGLGRDPANHGERPATPGGRPTTSADRAARAGGRTVRAGGRAAVPSRRRARSQRRTR